MNHSAKVKKATEVIMSALVGKLLIQHRKHQKLTIIQTQIEGTINAAIEISVDDSLREQKDLLEEKHKAEIAQLKSILVNPAELSGGQRIKLLFTGKV